MEFGNGLNYLLTITKNNFINTFNELIDIIHEEDPDHPISTSVSGTSWGQTLGIHLHSPMLDMVGFNAFGNISKVEPLMKQIGYVTNPKPYYMTEWGIHGPWESPFSLWWAPVEYLTVRKEKYIRTHIELTLKTI